MKKSISALLKPIELFPITKEKGTGNPGKLINLDKPEKKTKILLPPAPERYIKTKEHDFL